MTQFSFYMASFNGSSYISSLLGPDHVGPKTTREFDHKQKILSHYIRFPFRFFSFVKHLFIQVRKIIRPLTRPAPEISPAQIDVNSMGCIR